MSEYQYYEFLAVDRPLNDRQLAEVRGVSTRAELTPTSFVNEYHFGDFKGDPIKFLRKYYDLMVHYANWGTHRFMFSVPRQVIDPRQAEAYCLEYSVEMHIDDDKLIFDLTSQVEDWDWEEADSGWMAALAPVRDLVIGGDLRPLYLAWLSGLPDVDLNAKRLEPPVPPGLGQLTAPLYRLAEYLRVDEDLLHVAAQSSAPLADDTDERFERWLSALPEAEKTGLLKELATGADPHAAATLRRRFLQEHAASEPGNPPPPRSVGQLLQDAREASQQREQRQRALAAKRRAQSQALKARKRADYLDSIDGRQETLWNNVEALVAEKNAQSYDQAVNLLIDLRDLAERRGQTSTFEQRLAELRQRHRRKSSFIQRLRKAALQ